MPPRKRRQSTQGDDNGKESQDRLTQNDDYAPVNERNKVAVVRGGEGGTSQCLAGNSNERRLTVRQAAGRVDGHTEGSNSVGTEVKDRPVQHTVGTATRSSTRIVKRPRRDLSPPESPVKKAIAPKDLKAVISTPETKTKRQWELWSVEDKNTFFEGLSEYGKDFDAIHNAIVTKYRKKGITDPTQVKNKEQVRHFYYRTWHKINKLIQPVDDLKKDIQELYGLISYGVMRKRIRGGINPADKNWQKLNELVHQGSTTVKVKGKNFRIKTPICPALKKLNNIEEPRKDAGSQLPDKVTLEFRPKTNTAWSHVQSMAHNPRLKITTKPERTLHSIISFLDRKWRPHRLKVKDSLACTEEADTELRVYPHRHSVLTAINLDVAEEPKLQFGLDTYKDTVQLTSPVLPKCHKKGTQVDGRKADNASDLSEAVIGDKMEKSCCRECKHLCSGPGQCVGGSCNNEELQGSDLSVMGSIPSACSSGRIISNTDLSAIVEGEDAMFPDKMLPLKQELEETASSSSAGETQIKTEVEADGGEGKSSPLEERTDAVEPVEIAESSQSEQEKMCRNIIANGWKLGGVETKVTIAELYLMFGNKGELHFEYDWCKKDSSAIQDSLLTNLSNMLRRLSHLAAIEFTDFSKVPGVGSPCHMCGNVVSKQSRGQKGANKSPTSSKTISTRPQKDVSTQTQGAPLASKKESLRVVAPAPTPASEAADPVFRIPGVNLYPQKSLTSCTLTDKELVQQISPNFNKPHMRPRKLKSVSRKPVIVQRTILPKAHVPSRQMVTFLPVMAGQSISNGDTVSLSNQINHTVSSEIVTMTTVTSVLSPHQNVCQTHRNEGGSPVTTCHISSPSDLQAELTSEDSQPLLSIPAHINVGLSPETMRASGLTTSTVTMAASTSTQNKMTSSVSAPHSSISPPNISSLLEISFSNISTVGDGDKFMDLSMDGATSSFTGLLEENKVLSVDPGLITPPLRTEAQTTLHSPPVRSLFKISSPSHEHQWLNGEAPDLSLTSFLESPVKPVATTTQQSFRTSSIPLFSEGSRDFLSSRIDVDTTLQCMMNESSVDYVRKFADLAEQIAQDGLPTAKRKPETKPQPV